MNTAKMLFAVLALALHAGLLHAQAWPSRTIRLIVPFEAGGPTDTLARGISAKLGEGLGVTVVAENRAGAATLIAAELVAKAPPDGYTLFLTTATAVSINPHMYSKLSYNPDKDFVPVGKLGSIPYGIFAHAAVPFNNLNEMLAYAKANPGKINVGLSGAGAPPHLALQMLENASGTRFTPVQYKGNTPALNDLLGGRVDLMLSAPLLMFPHVKSGKLKVIAVTSQQRFAHWPDIPALAEIYPGLEAQTWFGIMAPGGTSRDIVMRLNAEMQKFVKDGPTREKMAALALVLDGGTPEQLAAYIKEESDRWGKIIRQMGLKLD